MAWLSTGSKAQLFSMRRRIMYLYNENSVIFKCWLCSYHHQICLQSWQAADFIWISNGDYTWQWWIPQGFQGLGLAFVFQFFGPWDWGGCWGIFSVTVQWGFKELFPHFNSLITQRWKQTLKKLFFTLAKLLLLQRSPTAVSASSAQWDGAEQV